MRDPLDAVVVIPARDEAQQIGPALRAIAAQSPRVATAVIVVDDGSTDGTRAAAEHAVAIHGLDGTVIDGPACGVGWARRVGFERAARIAAERGTARCLLVSTDADSRADPGWLAGLVRHAQRGAAVIAGDIRPRGDEPAPPSAVTERRAAAARGRLVRARRDDGPAAEHHHFAAGNLAIDRTTYARLGQLPAPRALEDEALLDRLRAIAVPVVRTAEAVVRTSTRTVGRASHGLADDLALETWRATRRRHHTDYELDRLAELAAGGPGVTVVVPARDEAPTIGAVLERTVGPLREAGVVDEVVVVDRRSPDGTAAVAAAHGARVVQRDDVRPEFGPGLGKGDALWRGLQRSAGGVIAFLDADTRDPDPAHLIGLVGPLLCDPSVEMVRGAYRRDRVGADGVREPHGGGRVTELCARPLLMAHRPRLSAFAQPLAGEFAARRWLLESMPFPVGYGVEIATLLDAEALVGLEAIAEVDLGVRQNRHRPLRELSPMAFAVHAAVRRRVDPEAAVPSLLHVPWSPDPLRPPIAERPPIRELPQAPARHRGSRRHAVAG